MVVFKKRDLRVAELSRMAEKQMIRCAVTESRNIKLFVATKQARHLLILRKSCGFKIIALAIEQDKLDAASRLSKIRDFFRNC